jgi:hypothetical protein
MLLNWANCGLKWDSESWRTLTHKIRNEIQKNFMCYEDTPPATVR